MTGGTGTVRLHRVFVIMISAADESTTGPASFMTVDPDGNAILVVQHL